MKQVSWVLALVIGIAIGFFAKSALVGVPAPSLRPAAAPGAPQAQRPARPQEDPKAVYKVPLADSPVKGPADALVTIVESSDFECPFCKRVGPTLKQLEQAYPGKLRFAFKHNPLPFHQSALPAALAAEEARAQKGDAGFWAMHDALFDAAPSLDQASLEKAAAAVGLDLGKFRAALAQKTHEPRIRRDQQLVTGVGASGTPAFFINGRKLSGAQPFESFKAIVDEELKKAEALAAGGTPRAGLYAAIVDKGAEAPVMLPGAPAAPGQAAPQAAPPAPATLYRKVAVRPDDPSRGPADAKVTVVLFSDFQCPFCSRVEPTLKELEAAFPGQLRIVWKHQPLPFHPNARPAALAAEAAREQGKFWQFHEKAFANQQQLSPAAYEGWAREIGLDLGKFKASVAAARGEARIAEDQAQAKLVGAEGTPTLFFNCRQVVGALPITSMRPIVEEELKKADALLAKGVKRGPGFAAEACDANVAAAPAAAPVPAAAPAPSAPVKVELRPDDPVKGNPRAPVTVVVFSDFQCPFCSRVEPTLKQVEQAYGDKVRIAWKHKPLPFHPNAQPAAEASEAAREQGKFWEMHDKMFQNQQQLSPAAYEAWARELGLDLGRFKAAIASGKHKARIQEDDALAGRLGIDGTPTLVINGEKVVGAQPFEAMKAVIDRALAKK